MRELRGKVALVTGAGSGIGRATALALADEGCRLVVCDIAEGPLQAVSAELSAKGSLLLAARVDVSKRAEMEAFAAQVHALVPAVDVLVNNAGVGLSGGLLDTTLEDWEWILSINLWGVLHGLHCFVPRMAARGAGHVVNVSSGLGLVAAPEVIGYCTSKFAVTGLSESLRAELGPKGVGVSTICPGFIRTAIFRDTRARGVGGEEKRAKIARLVEQRGATPEKVAAAIIDAVRGDKGVVPVALEAWVSWWLKRYVPWVLPPLLRWIPK
jgi:NAD(P)-dependent dehydrogenase (short-subunit alcohol dehydrogenase family)